MMYSKKALTILFFLIVTITCAVVLFFLGFFSTMTVFALLAGKSDVDGLIVIGFIFQSVLFGTISAFLSLLPSYLISMKLARWLREKHGWPINRPRRLFAYAVITPVILVALFFLIASVL